VNPKRKRRNESMGQFQGQLNKMKSNWKKAAKRDPNTFSGSEVEDGRYIARIEAMSIDQSMSSGRLQMMTEFKIIEGPETGQTVRSYDGMETEDGMFYLMRKLARLGQEVPDDPTELESLCEKIEKEKPVVRIRLKTKGEFQNTYVDKLIGHAEAAEESAPGEVTPEDEGRDDEGDLEVGNTVKVLLKGKEIEATVTKVLDEESFKARTPDGKDRVFSTDDLVKEGASGTEGEDDEGVVDISVGDKLRVNVKGKPTLVTVTKIMEGEDAFKAKSKDGKTRTYSADDIVMD
jgi:hypothetical protein